MSEPQVTAASSTEATHRHLPARPAWHLGQPAPSFSLLVCSNESGHLNVGHARHIRCSRTSLLWKMACIYRHISLHRKLNKMRLSSTNRIKEPCQISETQCLLRSREVGSFARPGERVSRDQAGPRRAGPDQRSLTRRASRSPSLPGASGLQEATCRPDSTSVEPASALTSCC